MVTTTGGADKPYCFDTTCFAHFARAERLDVLRELLVEHECWTTTVVLAEIRRGTESEASVLAAAELRNGIAITDDRDATAVARQPVQARPRRG